jgi:polyisoprenoid-binding protein YceI
MNRIAVALAVVALSPATGLAEPTTWNLDPAHSHASFTVRHLGISNVRGDFGKLDGKLLLDEKDPTKSRVDATIDVNSINTRIEKRDAHLKSPDFFDAQNHPNLTFKSTKVEKSGKGFKVTGDLTIRGNTKPVVLTVDEFTKPIKDMQGASRRAMHATTKINRHDFGLKWNNVIETGPVVGDQVTIELAAEFVQAPASPAGQAKVEDAAASAGKKDGPAEKKAAAPAEKAPAKK